MDPINLSIRSALIIAGGYIVAAFVAGLFGYWRTKQKRIRENLQEKAVKLGTEVSNMKNQLNDLDRQLKEALTGPKSLSATLPEEQFGFKTRRIRKFVEVKMDGSCDVTFERLGTKATSQTILHFTHGYNSLIPRAQVSDPERLKKPHPSKSIRVQIIKKSPGECRFFVTVPGGLSPSDKQLSYGFAYSSSKSFCMSEREIKSTGARLEYEYSSWLITAPTDVLELVVQFPPKYSVECFLGVFVGDTEFMNDWELQHRQKQKCLTPLPRGARIQIRKPLIGFRYAICWLPMRHLEYRHLTR